MAANEIEIADLERLARSDSPDLARAVIAFLEQPDPTYDKAPPPGSVTLAQVLGQVSYATLRWVAKPEKRQRIVAAWKTFLTQTDPPVPPRFALAALLVDVYERDTDAGRAAIVEIAQDAPLRWGLWAGLKRIYKLAEKRMDAEIFGVLAWRFDHAKATGANGEVSAGTTLYLRRRAWRFLAELGRSVPALYPQFAAQVLRHYLPDTRFIATWIANHVWAHGAGKYNRQSFTANPPNDLTKHRAFDDAWKRSPDALMGLLEGCRADLPARFAIQGLKRDFPEALRSVTPAWLARLASRPLEGVHEFLIETLDGSPEFHASKLRGLGLHEAALALLTSPSAKARAWAIEYARAHAQDLSADRLADLLDTHFADVKKFAAGALQAMAPRALGVSFLGRALNYQGEVSNWASKHLAESFDRAELPEDFLVAMLYGTNQQHNWSKQYISRSWKQGELAATFWIRVLDDPRQRDNYAATQVAVAALGKFPMSALPVGWLLDSLVKPFGASVGQWLQGADALPGLDIERLKGFVFNAAQRPVALAVLGNTKLVKPRELGLGWLLALARRADPSLHTFAHRYLLEHMRPEDFSENSPQATSALEAGIERLFSLALGEREPEPVRQFAQTYLRCHHPVVGPEQAESKSYGLKPALTRVAYTAARLWNALWDHRPDARRFAVTITRAELREWGLHTRVYELAESEHKEVRNVAYDALLKAGESGADQAATLKVAELDAAKIFALTESRKKSTREVGMEVIRKHYQRLGGAERLAWLMESPDREVRLFSVRLLWERHRPTHLPRGWKPTGKNAASVPETARFEDVDALRDFLRRVLFGLPPGRMERRDGDGPSRHIPASEAKRNVIAVLRDMGVEEAAFAQLVAPVLGEFTGSLARGEWQACLAALVQLRGAHPGLELGGLV